MTRQERIAEALAALAAAKEAALVKRQTAIALARVAASAEYRADVAAAEATCRATCRATLAGEG